MPFLKCVQWNKSIFWNACFYYSILLYLWQKILLHLDIFVRKSHWTFIRKSHMTSLSANSFDLQHVHRALILELTRKVSLEILLEKESTDHVWINFKEKQVFDYIGEIYMREDIVNLTSKIRNGEWHFFSGYCIIQIVHLKKKLAKDKCHKEFVCQVTNHKQPLECSHSWIFRKSNDSCFDG